MDLSSESSDVSSPEYLGDSCSDEEYRPQQTLCRSGTSRRKISKKSRGNYILVMPNSLFCVLKQVHIIIY